MVEGGGIQVEIAAAPLPLETDEMSAMISRQFHNAIDAQHWLRRISVRELMATAYPHEQGALINGVTEHEQESRAEDGEKPKRSAR